jgi:hypothetical protein
MRLRILRFNTEKTKKIKKIKIPDAIILATAKVKKAHILSANSSDFKGVDSTVKILHLSL